MRFFEINDLSYVIDIVKFLKNSSFYSISIFVKYSPEYLLDDYISFLNSNLRLMNLVVYSAPEILTSYKSNINLTLTTQNLTNESCCGSISFETFRLNITMFMESKLYNNCLNRKISIDCNGDIKNCPSSTKIFGNIKTSTLKEAMENKSFYDLWGITKDQIDICKDCEFRYMCSDCRVILSEKNNKYSKPLKCNYNPYINEWE